VDNKTVFVVMGLRNPELKRLNDRHNVGSRVLLSMVKEIAEQKINTTPSWMLRDDSLTLELSLNRRTQLVLVMSNLSMNDSGTPVKKVLDRYNVNLDNLIVIQDDLDMPFGKIRIKRGGKDGGHRGIRSIIERVKSENFMRLKIGVGRPPSGVDVLTYVLSPFTKEERESLVEICKSASEAVRMICIDGLESAQNKVNER
jgi:PTH1 family peptidyl-tRNA hydrolase